MKMICPHCGVKGSADDSLLETKVKCPKCLGIFKVTSEIVQPIPFEEIELEQLSGDPGPGHAFADTIDDTTDDISNEVDDIFDDIFGEEETITETIEEVEAELIEEESELLKLLNRELDEEPEEELVAALSDTDEEDVDLEEWAQGSAALSDFDEDIAEKSEELGEVELDDEDDTLTVIEDLPVETDSLLAEEEDIEEEIFLDDTDIVESFDDVEDIGKEGSGEADLTAEADDFVIEGLEADDSETEEMEADDFEIEGMEVDDPEMEETETDGFEIEGVEADQSVEESEVEVDDMVVISEAGETEEVLDEAQEQDNNTIQKCSACGEYVDPELKHQHGSNVYCAKCVPADSQDEDSNAGIEDGAVAAVASTIGKFTIGTLIKDSWHYCKGVKGSIWAGLIVMYLALFSIGAAGVIVVPMFPETSSSVSSILLGAGFEIVAGFLSYIFTAGLILIAVKRVGQQPYSWKMVFSGFKKLGTLTLAIILQLLLLTIGFCLLILPGIYLSVGYMLTFPLIMEKGLSPWQAMETSRKAIHKRWWTVFFAFIVLSIIASLSAIPVGIGLIWTVPMFFVMVGILYYHFFSDDE